jgi:hypothetical protein
MDFFSYTKKKIEEKIKDYFWGSFGMASWTFVIINLSMMCKTTRGKTYIQIYINIEEFNIWKKL